MKLYFLLISLLLGSLISCLFKFASDGKRIGGRRMWRFPVGFLLLLCQSRVARMKPLFSGPPQKLREGGMAHHVCLMPPPLGRGLMVEKKNWKNETPTSPTHPYYPLFQTAVTTRSWWVWFMGSLFLCFFCGFLINVPDYVLRVTWREQLRAI